jgi:2-polyprenyl-3-methyl-5-hydroxy-6-metoxy-1,4-benzoquinol methylase
MADVRRDWEQIYKNKAVPWDVGQAEDALVKLINSDFIKPCKVLEIGCGTGNDAIFMAKKGFDVTAIDISKTAIEEAKKRAEKAGVHCNFLAEDIAELKSVSDKFDFLYDRACFHFIPEEKRDKYIQAAKKLLVKDGCFVLIVSSEKDPVKGPYQFSKDDIKQLFGKDFDILEIKLITLEQHKEKPTPYFCLMKKK